MKEQQPWKYLTLIPGTILLNYLPCPGNLAAVSPHFFLLPKVSVFKHRADVTLIWPATLLKFIKVENISVPV